jgi:hypothetical protein
MVALAHVPANAAWAPNAGPQTAFLLCGHRESLYGGAAGGGKSDALLAAAVRYIDEPDMNAIIFRRSYPELRNLIRRAMEFYPSLGGVYNRAQHEWKFPSGAALIFRFISSEADVYSYQGDAFTFIGWDELTQFPGDHTDEETGETYNSAYIYMMSRLRRRAGSKIRLMVRATCNPGGVGHHWVKARFEINDAGDASVVKDPKTGLHRSFFPARIHHNPHLAGGEYERTLEAMSAEKRKSLKDGRWDIFAGAQFSEFNPRVHVVDPFPIPAHWPRWRGADDGFSAPACCIWLTQNPDTKQLAAYNELYKAGMTGPDFAERVKDIDRRQVGTVAPDATTDYTIPDENLTGILDSAAFASNGQSDVSRGDQMNRAGCGWKESIKGPGSRRLRVKRLHDLLKCAPVDRDDPTKGTKPPGIVFFKGCVPNLIRTIPALPKDPGDPEDVDTDAEDHPFDGLTYGLQWRESKARTVKVSGF